MGKGREEVGGEKRVSLRVSQIYNIYSGILKKIGKEKGGVIYKTFSRLTHTSCVVGLSPIPIECGRSFLNFAF